MKKLIFILSIFSLYYSACVTPCEYLVEIPFTIEGSDTISLGDTIWIESTLPLAFNDLNSDIQIPREEVIDMVTEIMIRNLDSMELNVGNLFTVLPTKGGINNIELVGSTTYQVLYEQHTPVQQFKAGIVPTQNGKFVLNLFSYFHTDLNLKDYNYEIDVDPACLDYLKVQYSVNEGNRNLNNYYLFEGTKVDPGLLDETSEQDLLERRDREGYFLFVVK